MSTRALAHLLLPLSLGLAACDPSDPKGGDSGGGEGAADGAEGGEGADGTDGDAPLASAGCTAELPWPRTIGPGGAEVEVTLSCADPEAARALVWTSNLGVVEALPAAEGAPRVMILLTDGDASVPSGDVGLTLTPSDGGSAVPVRLRAHIDRVEVPAPVLNPVDLGPFDLALPLAVGWAPPTEAGGRAWASQVQGDALIVAPLQLEGGACADCTARLDWTPGVSARRHLWAGGGRTLAAEGAPLLVNFDGDGLELSALLYQEGGAPLPVAAPLAVADGLKELAALGTVTAVHDLAGLVPGDPADLFGLALLLSVENGRGAYFAVLVNDQVMLTAEIDGLRPADVAAGQGVVGFLADADHRDALVREVSVGSVSAAEVDAPSCTVQLKVWAFGEEGMRVRRTRRLREACGGMDDAGLLHTANDPDGRPVDVVVLGGADSDRLWVGAVGDTELPPVSGLPDAYLVEGAARGGPELPNSGLMRSASGGLRGKVLTSDGLEYDRAGVGAAGRGRGPIQLTGRLIEAPLEPEGEGLGFQRSQALIRKELDKSTPILYRLSPPAGVSATVPARPDEPALVPGEELVLTRLDGRLYATRPTHPALPAVAGAPAEAITAAGPLFALVLGLNNTKKEESGPLGTLLESPEDSTITHDAVAVVGDEAIIFGTNVRDGGPSVCTFGADAPLACASGAGGFDQLRWLPQADGGALALVVRGGAPGLLRLAAGEDPLGLVADRGWLSLDDPLDESEAWVVYHDNAIHVANLGVQQNVIFSLEATTTGDLPAGAAEALLVSLTDDSPCGAGPYLFADPDGALVRSRGIALATPGDGPCSGALRPVGSADLLGLGAPQPLLWSPEGGLELLLIDAGEGTWARVPLGVAVGAAAVELSAADVDGDGLDDLFVRQAGLDRPALLLHSDGGGGLTEIALPDGALDGIWGLVGPGRGQPQRLDAPHWAPAMPELRR
jgi:hypothetical protein